MKNILPAEFRFSHEFAFFLHDSIAAIVDEGLRREAFSVRIDMANEAHAEAIQKVPQAEILDWLDQNGYRQYSREIVRRQVCRALLIDFCHFTYEALRCAQKGKMTVAFALIRKPFKDNLFYLEWLLADYQDFLQQFCATTPIVEFAKVDACRKKAIMRQALTRTAHGDWIDVDFLHEVRYDRKVEYGLEGIWNKAMHLVTTRSGWSTEPMNFNFVFSAEEGMYEQWDQFYLMAPAILTHALEIAEALVSDFVPIDDAALHLNQLRRIVGVSLWAESRPQDDESLSPGNPAETLKGLLPCANCHADIRFSKENRVSFYERMQAYCDACGAITDYDLTGGDDDVPASDDATEDED